METTGVSKYIENIREIKRSNTLFDLHVHPFDVFSNELRYARSRAHCGVYSAGDTPYSIPGLPERMPGDKTAGLRMRFDGELMMKAQCLAIRRSYCHTGPRVLRDHMGLCCFDKALLLPVMQKDEPDGQMELLKEMFGEDDNFLLGLCIPNNIHDNEINGYVLRAVNEYNVRAIKIHPNITGIDLAQDSGRQRVEAMLAASRITGLPVLIHGGRSPFLGESEAASYGSIVNLRNIDWGITDAPVVIAHAGLYGHDRQEVRETVLPLLTKMLDRCGNLFVDVSGLNNDLLSLVLRSVDIDRVVFGSDAFYDTPWKVAVRLFQALKALGPDYEENFLKITSHNPRNVVGYQYGTGGRQLAGSNIEATK